MKAETGLLGQLSTGNNTPGISLGTTAGFQEENLQNQIIHLMPNMQAGRGKELLLLLIQDRLFLKNARDFINVTLLRTEGK